MTTLEERINRIYAAIEGIREEDLTKFPPTVIDEHGVRQIWLDFRGGMTEADLQNAVHILIFNIAHVLDYLWKWAGNDQAKRSKVDATINACQPFLIIKDLCNNDKHGYPPRSSWSGLQPRITDISRPARARTEAVAGSVAGFSLDPATGEVTYFGSVDVIITGTVVDNKGDRVGDFYDIAEEAVEVIESLVANLGIVPKV